MAILTDPFARLPGEKGVSMHELGSHMVGWVGGGSLCLKTAFGGVQEQFHLKRDLGFTPRNRAKQVEVV